MDKQKSTGIVTRAFGNLVHVRFDGAICQGEIASIELPDVKLLAEVIEIAKDEAKLQVFEDTRDIQYGTKCTFEGHLLEAELGPGLLTSIFDGLQNPLVEVAQEKGVYLTRGSYLPSLDRKQKWEFTPTAEIGSRFTRGSCLGTVPEGRFVHKILVPFSLFGSFELTYLAKKGAYTLEEEIARVKDASGVEHSISMLQRWPVKSALLEGVKTQPTEMMDTGLRILDTQFPVMKGGTFCSPGPFGAGKTVMQHHLSKYSAVDIVVIVACGERAGEVVEVLKTFPEIIDQRTNESLMNRTVMICNTSSMPVAAREASVYMGVTIAEYYRQMGLNVLLLADSTSRWAQAMREMSGRLEEIPGEEAFPAYLASRIAAFYERAGVVQLPDRAVGSLTIGGSVSPAGGNFEEPVTQASLSVVGAFHGLSRARSDARRYPAIDPLISWTKYLDAVGKDLEGRVSNFAEAVKRSARILQKGDEIGKRMEVIGEEGIALEDLVLYLKAELYEFVYLQQNAFDHEDAYCPLERQLEVFQLIQKIFDVKWSFESHDAARSFFLDLQNTMKNLNFVAYQTEQYQQMLSSIEQKVES